MNLHSAARSLRFGAELENARAALILLHGRGSSADDIAGLARFFTAPEVAFIAPDATHNTWYPQRFLAPLEANEPWLTSALDVIRSHVAEVADSGINPDRIGLVGFSQGACLALEYASRKPTRYGFIGGLSGGLIGPLERERDTGDLAETPVLIACAEADAHIPLAHVEHSAAYFERCGAQVTKHIFPGSAHTVFPEEVDWLRKQVEALRT